MPVQLSRSIHVYRERTLEQLPVRLDMPPIAVRNDHQPDIVPLERFGIDMRNGRQRVVLALTAVECPDEKDDHLGLRSVGAEFHILRLLRRGVRGGHVAGRAGARGEIECEWRRRAVGDAPRSTADLTSAGDGSAVTAGRVCSRGGTGGGRGSGNIGRVRA